MSFYSHHVPTEPQSNYDKAVRELARRKAEKTLTCGQCARRNAPGRIEIDIDEYDRAWCQACGYSWVVRGIV